MGNKSSSSLVKEIDKIATKFIITQNFNDMHNLFNKEHCDKLVLLTSKIIHQNLDESEQKEVLQRIKPSLQNVNEPPVPVPAPAPPEGIPVPVPVPVPAPPQGVLVPAQEKDNINEENPIQQGGEEEKPCIEIAKYYVKIAHLYGAIMKTINPVIISKDKNGNKHKYDLSSKQSVPTDEEVKSIEHNNFCSRRLNSLIQESDYNRNDPNNLLINLKPRFCKINYDKNLVS